MLTISNRDAESQHPLASYVHPLWELARATGETVRLVYNDHPVEIRSDDESGSVAYETWHATYMDMVRRQS